MRPTHPKKNIVKPNHLSCRSVADQIQNRIHVPDDLYKAHIPRFVSRTGELSYKNIPITLESCQRVARAIVQNNELIPRQTFLAHVPEFVTKDGEVLVDKIPEDSRKEILSRTSEENLGKAERGMWFQPKAEPTATAEFKINDAGWTPNPSKTEESPEVEANEDFVVDLDNHHWVGIEDKRVIFGTGTDDKERIKFQSVLLNFRPGDDTIEMIGELLLQGMTTDTANRVLINLENKQTGQIRPYPASEKKFGGNPKKKPNHAGKKRQVRLV